MMQVYHGSFTPLGFMTAGGMGGEWQLNIKCFTVG